MTPFLSGFLFGCLVGAAFTLLFVGLYREWRERRREGDNRMAALQRSTAERVREAEELERKYDRIEGRQP